MKVIYFVFIIFIFIFLFFINNHIKFFVNPLINRGKNTIDKSVESFSSSLNPSLILGKTEFTEKFDFIYTTLSGAYNIIINNNLWVCNNNQQPKHTGNLSLKDRITTGFYNYSQGNVVFLDTKKMLTVFDIKETRVLEKIYYKKYFTNTNVGNIECLLYIDGLVYIFSNMMVIIYDIVEEKQVLKKKKEKIFKGYKGQSPSYIFLNNRHIEYQNPIPLIYVKSGGVTMVYRYKTYNIFEKTDEHSLSLNNLRTNTQISEYGYLARIIDHKFSDTGRYRIVTIGAGITSGGYGGMLFNDYIFNKEERIKLLVGESGRRMPVKKTITEDNLSNSGLDNVLPYYGSCSGSGGSFVLLDNKVIQASGGGGGWSSEVVKAPKICSSLPWNNRVVKNKDTNKKQCIFFPLHRIIIETENTDINDSYKIVLNRFDIETPTYNFIDISVSEYPLPIKKHKNSSGKMPLYETGYSRYGEKAVIDISLSNIITDYTINIEYEIKTHNERYVNSKMILFNENKTRYEIHNIEKHSELFGNSNGFLTLTPQNILYFLTKNCIPNFEINPKLDGFGIRTLTDTSDDSNLLLKFSDGDKGNKDVKGIKGGTGGGGNSYIDKFSKRIGCGGGGGYNGGKGCEFLGKTNNNQIDMNYIGGIGGTKKKQKNNLKNTKLLDRLFVSDFNSKNGAVYIIKIE